MATIKQRGNSFVLQWSEYDNHSGKQKQHRLSLGNVTAAQAERACKIKQLELEAGVVLDHGDRKAADDAVGLRFGEFYHKHYEPWYREQFPDSAEKVGYAFAALNREFEHVPLAAITTARVEAWKIKRMNERIGKAERWTGKQLNGKPVMEPGKMRKISAGTVKRDLSSLMAMLRRAVKWDMIPKMACAGVESVPAGDDEAPRMLSVVELRAIYAADPKHAPIWRLIVNTGMRRSEAHKARRSDVRDTTDGKAIVIESLPSKGARSKSRKLRTIPLNKPAREALAELESSASTEYLLPRITKTALSRRYERIAKRAGVKSSLHDLRHTFCSHLANGKVPVKVIKELAGHSTIAVTEKYLWMVKGAESAAVNVINL